MEREHLVGQQLGQYELLAELGKGTYAHVYEAFQPRLRRHVAIKVLKITAEDKPGFVERFEQIAQAIAQLNHPNIVSIYDFGEEQGLAYIVMQCVTGGTFQTLLGKPMTVGEAVTPIIQMARALHHAHQRGVLHLDLRPANVLIDQENVTHLLVSDFSLNQLFQEEHLASTGLPIGTPAYLAPEQIEQGQPSARTDVYALGALLYESLAGQPPFTGSAPITILNKHLHEPPPYIRGYNPAVPRELAQVVARAMNKRPEERYASAEEFARALEPYRDAKERHHRLNLSLDDLILDDDEDSAGAAQPPAGSPERSPADTRAPGADPARHPLEFAQAQEPPKLPERGAIVTQRISLVQSIGASVFRLARCLAGQSNLGGWLERLLPDLRAQEITGIASISLILLLSLSFTLLVAAAPPPGSERQVNLGQRVNQPTPIATSTPTATATATATATPSPTATPSNPTIDPQAAAVLVGISAALGQDPTCRSYPNGATLPAWNGFYVTLCFNPTGTRGGGTASVSIFPRGATSAIVQLSEPISSGSSYSWFQFGPLPPGSYTIEAFWNGKLGRVYLLTLS